MPMVSVCSHRDEPSAHPALSSASQQHVCSLHAPQARTRQLPSSQDNSAPPCLQGPDGAECGWLRPHCHAL